MPQSGLRLSAVVAVRVVLSTTYLNILTGSMDSLPRGMPTLDLQTKFEGWRSQDMTSTLAAVNQHAPFWVSLSLVVVIAWYLAKIFWALFPEPDIAISDTPARGASAPVTSAATKQSYEGIVDAHIFGESTNSDALPVMAAENAPETRLNLKLHGAVMSTDPTAAHAIISESGKGNEVYFVGDAIPGGAKLHEVQSRLVILNRGGVLETLKLPELTKGTSLARTPTSSARRSFGPRSVRDNSGDSAPDTIARFTDIVRPQPYMPNGKLKGYRLYPGRDRKRFAAIGLRPGDLVTNINGVPLNDMAQGMSMFQSMGEVTQLTVTLERNGQAQVLTIDTSEMTNKGDNEP